MIFNSNNRACLPVMMLITGMLFHLTGCQKSNSKGDVAPSIDLTLLGGAGTVFDKTSGAFSREPKGFPKELSRQFFRGRAFFRDPWVTAPASTKARDGLGPHFNARSCEACHLEDGRGRPPLSLNEPMTSLLFRISVPGETETGGPAPVPNYGGQIQNFAVLPLKAEAFPYVNYEIISGSFADGETYELRKPTYGFKSLAFGPLPEDVMISPRVAPAMIGLGLLEAIDESDILDLADPNDENGDGISGRVNRVWDVESQSYKIGRFGWKANQPNIRQQTAGAFLGDIGITSSMFPQENCPGGISDCTLAVSGGSPELLDVILDDVTLYSLSLAVPAQRHSDDPAVQNGYQVFVDIGCESCHRSTWRTGVNEASSFFSEQTIHPFTDLLLHDMGEDLADNRPDFTATGREWRTAPLWGLGLQETVNGHLNLMHDGRARGFSEAILWHGGEGEESKQRFKELDTVKRQELIRFLESL